MAFVAKGVMAAYRRHSHAAMTELRAWINATVSGKNDTEFIQLSASGFD